MENPKDRDFYCKHYQLFAVQPSPPMCGFGWRLLLQTSLRGFAVALAQHSLCPKEMESFGKLPGAWGRQEGSTSAPRVAPGLGLPKLSS